MPPPHHTLLGLLLATPLAAQEAPDFAREVLPILSNKCFVCHGPDPQKEDLVRLDSYAGATRDLGGYRAIDPEDPRRSEILARILDRDDPMPPRKAEKQLTQAERKVLTRWVRSGGKYAQHWAFVKPRKLPPPEVGEANPVDAHIAERLQERGLALAEPADRATLARRAALVLTGLPPEPAELAGFLADAQAGAYGRFVDRMLASPRFGEHQARYWLDAVRYGDTHGLHLDNRRGIYPYRDWVVRAFNQNLPLDEFIHWQVAGDLLPNPTLAQRVATGFVRMNPSTSEGGVIPAEFQAKNNFDRTETFGTVMLGMTLTCARCHTHKYDPIEHRDYYRLLAFFNNTTEQPLDGNSYTYAPVAQAPQDQAGWAAWEAVEADVRELLASVDTADADRMAKQRAKATAGLKWSNWKISKTLQQDEAWPAELGKARGLPGLLRRTKLGKGQKLRIGFELTAPTDLSLRLRLNGAPGTTLRVGEREVPLDIPKGQHSIEVPVGFKAGTHAVTLDLVGATRAFPVELRLRDPWRAISAAGSWARCSDDARLQMFVDPHGPFAAQAAQAGELMAKVEQVRRSFTTTLVAGERAEPRETRVLRRGEYNLPTGEALRPAVPAFLGQLPAQAPRNRLGLARWLTSRDNPLVARVLVNRIWQRVFGHGLVRSPEDFGLQGQHPTHPRLLDWLAVELQDSGWNLKQMLRLLVTSRSFRQHSRWRPEVEDPQNRLFARGPGHRLDAEVIRDIALWASGLLDPKMGGEGVKPYQPDGMWQALAHPASNTRRYVPDRDRRVYRRSLYVYWKRTSPHPMMTLFDAPSRETSCVRRSRTSTPLQALGLLNETQRLETARMLAQRLLHEERQDRTRLDRLFGWLACRPPSDQERRACTGLLDKMRRRYRRDAKAAISLLESPGIVTRDKTLDPAEHAAWAQLAITVLASDVALTLY